MFSERTLTISQEELLARQKRVLDSVSAKGGRAYLTFSSLSIFYLTGFYFISTERPACLVLAPGDNSFLYVPRLEVEHGELALVSEVVTYPEYPGKEHPMELLARALEERELTSLPLVAESKGYGSSMGYRGPTIDEVLPALEIEIDTELVEGLRMVKSPGEIELIKESVRWGNYAHTLLQDYCAPGRSENEVSFRATQEATMVMLKVLGPRYRALGRTGAMAGFRGQIGPNSALPHAVNINAVMNRGDVLVTGAAAGVGGYTSELERTMFLGKSSPQQERFFHHMMEMMEVAFINIKPGVPCSAVDEAVQKVYDKHGLYEHWRHHTGHALGILGHEGPFFDIGDHTIMKPGMVFSVEPGIYVPGLGGFRHSDTVLVTDSGVEILTYYPRELDKLTISC